MMTLKSDVRRQKSNGLMSDHVSNSHKSSVNYQKWQIIIYLKVSYQIGTTIPPIGRGLEQTVRALYGS